MADPIILRANERLKAASTLTIQWGSGLAAAAVIKLYVDDGVSWEAGSWLFVSAFLIFIGFVVLGSLESET